MNSRFLLKLPGLLILIVLMGCKTDLQKNKMKIDKYSYELGVVGGFSELIAAGVKQLALSAPMTPEEMDIFIIEAEKVAAKHGVSVYRESDLIITDLFPADVAEGKEVLLVYKGTTKKSYFALKSDKAKLEKEGEYDDIAAREISRRFGRLLSYSPCQINRLIAQNTSFRTMDDFGIRANNLFLYYQDLKAAGEFYSKTLGMEIVADYGMALILRMTRDSYLTLVDEAKGMHSADEPKTVALALLTDQLDEWYSWLQSKNVQINYEYKPKQGSAHDGFVVVDPEGYLLEFERFNQHPENERFIPLLEINKNNTLESLQINNLPDSLKIHSTIIWLYYKDVLALQNFYQNVLGLEMVADQGWTKIYKVSDSGFMAIVDEKRGMHKSTIKKAVNVGFIVEDLISWFDYVKVNEVMPLFEKDLDVGPENRYKSFVAFDPEGYYLEFDAFFLHNDNTRLLRYLEKE